jgi:hypothetical protein
MTMELVLDDRGFLSHPNLHDGFVDGINLVGEKAAAVLLRDVHGQTFSMQLAGAEALVCDNFQMGNIILDVQITSGVAPNRDTLGSLFVSPHPSAAKEFHDQHAQFLERHVAEVKERALVLVSIVPSYGCKLIALCREVQISRT